MAIINQLRTRLARWLLPTARADGEELFVPDETATARVDLVGDKPPLAMLRFEQSGEQISVVVGPALAREMGYDLLNIADEAYGPAGESIALGEDGVSYGGP